MRYVAAFLLSILGGNKNPSASDIENILKAVGIEADKECLDKVVKELKGKDIDEVIAAGKEKLASIPTGGIAAPSGGGAAAAAAAGDGGKAEEKKEEKKEESEEESDEDMGFGLFD